MYTIKMNSDGSLVCTSPSVIIYQTESLMDNIHFLLPKIYKERSLIDYTIILKYVNPANVAKLELLRLSDPDYHANYLEYILPITTELTKFSGDLTLYLTMTYTDSETQQNHIGHSGEITISITPVPNYFTDKDSLAAIDRQILELNEIAKTYEKSKADDIEITNGELYLKTGNDKIGTSIPISEIVGNQNDSIKTIYF